MYVHAKHLSALITKLSDHYGYGLNDVIAIRALDGLNPSILKRVQHDNGALHQENVNQLRRE
jgi:uncharacterized protein (DUF2132 family)